MFAEANSIYMNETNVARALSDFNIKFISSKVLCRQNIIFISKDRIWTQVKDVICVERTNFRSA